MLLKKMIILLLISISCNAFNLSDGFKYALENDMTLKVNKNNISNIEIDEEIADNLYNPKLDFISKVNISKRTEDKNLPDKNYPHEKNDEYKILLKQVLFDGFNASNEKKIQEKKLSSAVYFLKKYENDLALKYTQNYINIIKGEEVLSSVNEAIKISEEILVKVDKKINRGYGTKLEHDEAEAKLVNNKVTYRNEEIRYHEAVENLKFYVQQDFDTKDLIKPKFHHSLPKDFESALEKAYSLNPSLKVSQINFNVAKVEARKKNKNFYPNLDLLGSYELKDLFYNKDEKYNRYELGLQLSYNIYNGGKDSLEKRKSLQNMKEKDFLIKKAKHEIKNNLSLSWNSFKINEKKYKNLRKYVAIKKEVLEGTKKEFDLGLKTLEALLTSHEEYIEAKQDLIRNTYDLLFSKFQVLANMGILAKVLKKKKLSPKKILYKSK